MSRIETLLAAMTLAEKLGQLTMTAAPYAVTGPFVAGDLTAGIRAGTIGNLLNLYGPEAIRKTQRLAVEETRLGIPLLFGFDVIHGHHTAFPVPLGEASAFDPDLWRRTAASAAAEAAADGIALAFAPMLDVARDPRWGRMVEGPGEDPCVGAAMARAKVAGLQGDDLSRAVAACAKHYVAYGAVTAGREYASTDVSQRALREIYLPPFEAALEAGVATVMPAFTDLAGVPLTAHRALLEEHLRGALGFEGVIVSDYNAIAELIRHGVAGDLAEAAALALNAGVDIDMMAGAYGAGLPEALARGSVTMAAIDRAVRRVLTLKERLGLFDDPYRRGSQPEDGETLARRRALAREAAAESVVLLKNDSVLPLDRPERIALIGPLADAGPEMRGPWAGTAPAGGNVSLLEGLRAALPGSRIDHAAGVAIEGGGTQAIAAALALCQDADTVILCLGETAAMSGEAASRAHPHLPGLQQTLCDALFAATDKPVVTVLFSGRPLAVPALAEKSAALLAAWFPGCEAGHALAELLLGRRTPGGHTPVTWPRATGQIPLFYAQRNSGRPFNPDDHYTSHYSDESNAPLFPFGHGLSYGRVAFSDLRLSAASLRENEILTVRVTLANDGAHAARQTVFLFVHDKVASVTRPLLELKAWRKRTLGPGEKTEVALDLKGSDLRFPGPGLSPVFEPGDVEILVGPSADRGGLLSAPLMLKA